MNKACLTALLILLFAGAVSAGETGIINQAGPYEATMKFYLHPAHGFPGAAEAMPPTAASASENANTERTGKTTTQSRKMLAARSPRQPVRTRVATDLQFDP